MGPELIERLGEAFSLALWTGWLVALPAVAGAILVTPLVHAISEFTGARDEVAAKVARWSVVGLILWISAPWIASELVALAPDGLAGPAERAAR